jgi:ParB family chromosome partitioning protein
MHLTKQTPSGAGKNAPQHQARNAGPPVKTKTQSLSVKEAIALNERTIAEAKERGGVTDLGHLRAREQNALARGEGYQLTKVSLVDRSPLNREEFDAQKLAEMIESVRQHGIIQPLILRPRAGGRFEIVVGERRWRAALVLKLEVLPAIVRELDDRTAQELRLTENLQREDLKPLDEARGYKALMDLGNTIPELVAKLNVGKTVIYARLALLGLPKEATDAMEAGKLTASVAELITRVDNVGAQRELTQAILHPKKYDEKDAGGVLSFRRAKDLVEDKREEVKDRKAWEKEQSNHLGHGVTVLSYDASAKLMPYSYSTPAGYVKASDSCRADPKRRNYETLLRKREVHVTIVREPNDGKPVILILQKDAAAALLAAGYDFSIGEGESPKSSDAEKDKARAKRERAAIRRAAWKAAMTQLVAAVERGGDNETLLRLIAELVLGRLACSSRRAQEVVTRRGIEETNVKKWTPEKILRAHVKDGFNAKQLRGFIVEAIAWQHEPFDYGESAWPVGFVDACKLWKVDPKAIEEGFRASGKGKG